MKRRTYILVTLALAVLFAGRPAFAAETAAQAMPSAAPLTRDSLLAALSHDLAAHFNLEGELELELLRPWTPPAELARAWNVTISEYPSVAASTMIVRCRVVADGRELDAPTFVLRAALWREAWATRGQLTYGSTFDPTLLEAQRVDFLRDRDALPAVVGDRTYIFARGVSPGHLLTWRDIARRPLVKKGELVDVSAVEGPLIVTMKGLAMENGGQGDTITIRNPESRKDFAALVVDENRVQVRF
jgi:flagella basal body P-ring formation protein FlgA